MRLTWSLTSRRWSRSSDRRLRVLLRDEQIERLQQRVHRAVELGQLATQEVDPLRLVAALAEDVDLDLLDVVLDPRHDRLVVVDDLVRDRPDGGGRPFAQELGLGLQALARLVQLARRAVADDDHVAGAREDVHLAELDLLAVVEIAGGVQDEEVAVVVVLDLRALVGVHRVLDGERRAGRSARRPRAARRDRGRACRSRRTRRRRGSARRPRRATADPCAGEHPPGSGRSRRSPCGQPTPGGGGFSDPERSARGHRRRSRRADRRLGVDDHDETRPGSARR